MHKWQRLIPQSCDRGTYFWFSLQFYCNRELRLRWFGYGHKRQNIVSGKLLCKKKRGRPSDKICGCSEGEHAEAWCDAEDC